MVLPSDPDLDSHPLDRRPSIHSLGCGTGYFGELARKCIAFDHPLGHGLYRSGWEL